MLPSRIAEDRIALARRVHLREGAAPRTAHAEPVERLPLERGRRHEDVVVDIGHVRIELLVAAREVQVDAVEQRQLRLDEARDRRVVPRFRPVLVGLAAEHRLLTVEQPHAAARSGVAVRHADFRARIVGAIADRIHRDALVLPAELAADRQLDRTAGQLDAEVAAHDRIDHVVLVNALEPHRVVHPLDQLAAVREAGLEVRIQRAGEGVALDRRGEGIEPLAAVCAGRRAGAVGTAEAVERGLHVGGQDVFGFLQVLDVAVRQRHFPLEVRAPELGQVAADRLGEAVHRQMAFLAIDVAARRAAVAERLPQEILQADASRGRRARDRGDLRRGERGRAVGIAQIVEQVRDRGIRARHEVRIRAVDVLLHARRAVDARRERPRVRVVHERAGKRDVRNVLTVDERLGVESQAAGFEIVLDVQVVTVLLGDQLFRFRCIRVAPGRRCVGPAAEAAELRAADVAHRAAGAHLHQVQWNLRRCERNLRAGDRALKYDRAGVRDGRRQALPAVRTFQHVQLCPIAIDLVQRAAMLIAQRDEQLAGRAQVRAPQRVDAVVAVGIVDVSIVAVELETFEALARDVVDYACDRVRAVRRRAAGLQRFHAADGGVGNPRDVVEAPGGHRELLRKAPPVEHDGGEAGAEAAQVDRGRADRIEVRAIVFAGDAAGLAHQLDQVEVRRPTHVLDLFVADDLDGNRRVFGRAAQERACDHDLFELGSD